MIVSNALQIYSFFMTMIHKSPASSPKALRISAILGFMSTLAQTENLFRFTGQNDG